jgi:hypothetical protein
MDDPVPERPAEGLGPEEQALVADAVGPALLVVLDTLGPGGRPRMAFAFTVAGGRIAEIRLLADPERLREVELVGPDRAG